MPCSLPGTEGVHLSAPSLPHVRLSSKNILTFEHLRLLSMLYHGSIRVGLLVSGWRRAVNYSVVGAGDDFLLVRDGDKRTSRKLDFKESFGKVTSSPQQYSPSRAFVRLFSASLREPLIRGLLLLSIKLVLYSVRGPWMFPLIYPFPTGGFR